MLFKYFSSFATIRDRTFTFAHFISLQFKLNKNSGYTFYYSTNNNNFINDNENKSAFGIKFLPIVTYNNVDTGNYMF